MRTNLLMATVSGMAALAMNGVYGGWSSGIWSWLGFQVPAVLQHLAWTDFSAAIGAIHTGAYIGTMLLMGIGLGVRRG